MRTDIGFFFVILLFLGDVFWINTIKISQLGLIFLVWMIYRDNRVISKKYLPYIGLIICYNLVLNLSNLIVFWNSMMKISLFIILVLCAFDMKRNLYQKLFGYYSSLAFFVIAIWWLQLLAFIVSSNSPLNLELVYDSSLWSYSGNLHMVGSLPRLNSFYSEPSYLGLFILPLFASKLKLKEILPGLIVLIPLLMTFSLNVYVGVGVLFLCNLRWNYQTILVGVSVLILTMTFGLHEYILHRLSIDSRHVDLTLLLYIFHFRTYLLDWQSFIFGYGFDNYFLLFQDWRQNFESSNMISIAKTIPDDDLMLQSGPLLIIRLIVELGYGLVLAFAFGLRKYLFVNSYWIYALIGLSLRDGDYLRPFFLFFLIMHISNSIIYHKQINNERDNTVRTVQS